jgi:hypothetical protein
MTTDTSLHKWTISGVSLSARKVAKDAARRENMKLGEWLEQAVRQAADSGVRKVNVEQTQDSRPNRRYF